MSRVTVKGRLAAAVADAGTFTVSYPARPSPELGVYDEGDFARAMQHQLIMGQAKLAFPTGFTLTFGTSNITVTNASGSTWPIDTDWVLGLEFEGKPVHRSDFSTGKTVNRVSKAVVVKMRLGAPDVIDVNGIAEAQSPTGAGNLTLDGALADSDGVVTLDVPRNVVIDSGGADTAVLTVTGEDEYGNAMSEAITLNGLTAVSGKKAFKKITQIAHSATIANGAFVGQGDVLGLPAFLASIGDVLAELEDHAAATAGTVVAGIRIASTTTTGDVRGTYDPNSACDGAKVFELIVAMPDPQYLGVPQA